MAAELEFGADPQAALNALRAIGKCSQEQTRYINEMELSARKVSRGFKSAANEAFTFENIAKRVKENIAGIGPQALAMTAGVISAHTAMWAFHKAVGLVKAEVEDIVRKWKDAADAQTAFNKGAIASVGLGGLANLGPVSESQRAIAKEYDTTTDKVQAFQKRYKEARPLATDAEIDEATRAAAPVAALTDMGGLGGLAGGLGRAGKLTGKEASNAAILFSAEAQGREGVAEAAMKSLERLTEQGMEFNKAGAAILGVLQHGGGGKEISALTSALTEKIERVPMRPGQLWNEKERAINENEVYKMNEDQRLKFMAENPAAAEAIWGGTAVKLAPIMKTEELAKNERLIAQSRAAEMAAQKKASAEKAPEGAITVGEEKAESVIEQLKVVNPMRAAAGKAYEITEKALKQTDMSWFMRNLYMGIIRVGGAVYGDEAGIKTAEGVLIQERKRRGEPIIIPEHVKPIAGGMMGHEVVPEKIIPASDTTTAELLQKVIGTLEKIEFTAKEQQKLQQQQLDMTRSPSKVPSTIAVMD